MINRELIIFNLMFGYFFRIKPSLKIKLNYSIKNIIFYYKINNKDKDGKRS